MKNHLLFLATIILSVLLSGCNKDTAFNEGDLSIAEDEVLSLTMDEAVDQMISPASFGGHLAIAGTKDGSPGKFRFFPFKNFPECAVITVPDKGFPKEIVMDFDGECDMWHGHVISGKIIITISDTITKEGSTLKVVYENLKIGARSIEGESISTNEGLNSNRNLVISFTSTMSVAYDNGHISKREFSGEKEWISGFFTPQTSDDQFYKSGSGSITVDNEVKFTRVITTPLFIDRACRFILSGVVEITRGEETMIIDYGDGICDNNATVTKDGITEEIELANSRFRNQSNKHNRSFRLLKGWW